MVAVKTATTEPKLACFLVNWVTTIMAPPQPGKAPKIEAKLTSRIPDLARR